MCFYVGLILGFGIISHFLVLGCLMLNSVGDFRLLYALVSFWSCWVCFVACLMACPRYLSITLSGNHGDCFCNGSASSLLWLMVL